MQLTYNCIVFSLFNYLCDLYEAAISASWNTASLVELVNNELEAMWWEEIVDEFKVIVSRKFVWRRWIKDSALVKLDSVSVWIRNGHLPNINRLLRKPVQFFPFQIEATFIFIGTKNERLRQNSFLNLQRAFLCWSHTLSMLTERMYKYNYAIIFL